MDKVIMEFMSMVLPEEVLAHFDIVSVERTDTEMHIHLDEKMHKDLQEDVHFESKGFIAPVSVTDFPIRDHKVILVLRRRKWLDLRTGKSFILPVQIAAEGTRYSKEFAAFLKYTYGDVPSDLPYA